MRELRIGEGGLLHRLEAVARLTSLQRQIVTALSIIWLPVVVLGLATEALTGEPEPIIRDVSLHVRALVATPVLLILDHMFPTACRNTLEQLVVQGFVPVSQEPRFELLLRRAARLATAMLPELVFALLAFALGVAALWGMVPVGNLNRAERFSAAQIWYVLVDFPFFQFLFWRALWRWAIWARILLGLSRMELALVPAHPDRRAGVQFLSLPSFDYCAMMLFAVSSVLCAEWRGTLTFETFESFEPVLVTFAAVAILLAFGPLFCFTPPLMRARRAGLTESAAVASAFSRRFRREWLEPRDPDSLPTDLMPLVNITEIYRQTAQRVIPILFDVRDLVFLLVATLLPVGAVMLIYIPVEDWRLLFGLLTGGRLM